MKQILLTLLMMVMALGAIAQDGNEQEISREEAIAELSRAIENAQTALDTYGEITTPGIRTALTAGIPTAKVMLTTVTGGSFLADRISTEAIVTTYTSLDNLSAGAEETPLHYREALQAIEHARDINMTGTTAIATTAKVAVDASLNNNAISTALLTMRASLLALLSASSIPEETQLTALIGNNSFETGDDSGWYNVGAGTDVGAKAISDGYDTANADGDYIFNASQTTMFTMKLPSSLILQPMLLLPAGSYRLEASMASKSDCYLSVVTLALSDIPELQEKINDEDGNLSMEAIIELVTDLYSKVNSGDYSELMEYLAYMKYADVTYSDAMRPASDKAFDNHSVEFKVDDARSLVVIFANAGKTVDFGTLLSIDFTKLDLSNISQIMQLMGTLSLDAFKADNFRMTYVKAPEKSGIETIRTTPSDDTLYNIYGTKVNEGYKGIVIKGGKKILQ